MRTVARLATAMIIAALAALPAGCGAGAPEQQAPSALTAEVLQALQMPENPYRIIYSPPVDLAKRPTAAP